MNSVLTYICELTPSHRPERINVVDGEYKSYLTIYSPNTLNEFDYTRYNRHHIIGHSVWTGEDKWILVYSSEGMGKITIMAETLTELSVKLSKIMEEDLNKVQNSTKWSS